MTQYRSRISGTGSYLPEKRLTNDDLAKMVDTNDQWIRERTGIASRRIAAEGQVTSDLAYNASIQALQAAGLDAKDIDMILVATVSPDLDWAASMRLEPGAHAPRIVSVATGDGVLPVLLSVAG